MGKLVRYRDGKLELDILTPLDLELARYIVDSYQVEASTASPATATLTKAEKQQSQKTSQEDKGTLRYVPSRYDFPEDTWELISQTLGERRGAINHNLFALYMHRKSNDLYGIMKSKRGERLISLGSPDDAKSTITQIRRAVESMPFAEGFTRRQLMEVLPSHLARYEIMKFGMDYLTHTGVMATASSRQFRTGAKTYIRRKEKSDSPRQESVHEAAGAILR